MIAARGAEYFGGPGLKEGLLLRADLLHVDLIEPASMYSPTQVERALRIRTADDGVIHHLLGHTRLGTV